MPARDVLHDSARNALVKDGWIISQDPFRLTWGRHYMYVDLAAERLVAAEKEGRQIAVEVKTFSGLSPVHDLEQAVGQYLVYRSVLARREPNRTLYLAVTAHVFTDLFNSDLGQLVREDYALAF